MIKLVNILKEVIVKTKGKSLEQLESELIDTLKKNINQVNGDFRRGLQIYLSNPEYHKEVIDTVVSQVKDDPMVGGDIFGDEAAQIAYAIYNLKHNPIKEERSKEDQLMAEENRFIEVLKRHKDQVKGEMWKTILSLGDDYIDRKKNDIIKAALDSLQDNQGLTRKIFGFELFEILIKIQILKRNVQK